MHRAVHPVGGEGFEADRYVGDDDRDRRLARLVAVGDHDIRIHLERVNRRVAASDADGAYGALLDLFIATDRSTSGIRSRVMFWASELLDEDRSAALQQAVATGLESGDPMPFSASSVLSRGVTGLVRLVAPQQVSRPAPSAEDGLGPAAQTAGDEPAARPMRTPGGPGPGHAAAPVPDPAPMSGRSVASVASAPSGRFDLATHLIGAIQKAAEAAAEGSPVSVRGPFGSLVVTRDLVEPDLIEDLMPWLQQPVGDGTVTMSRAPGWRFDPSRAWKLEVVLWNLAVATSSGRVPIGLPDRGTLALRRWPDLTRVARLPGDTRLAALLHGQGATLADVMDRAPDRSAAASFLAAAWVTGLLIVRDDDTARAGDTAPPSGPASIPVLRDLVGRLRRMARR